MMLVFLVAVLAAPFLMGLYRRRKEYQRRRRVDAYIAQRRKEIARQRELAQSEAARACIAEAEAILQNA